MESSTLTGRADLLALLDRYTDAWPNESAMVARVRLLVEQHEDCFERTCGPGHITASAWVLSRDRRRCLLLHHKKLGRWLQPGGHADGDPDVLAVARREVEEETGLANTEALSNHDNLTPFDVDVHLIPERRKPDGRLEPEHEHHDLRFLLAATDDTPLALSHESHELRWCTPDEVHALADEESVLRLLRKASMWMVSE